MMEPQVGTNEIGLIQRAIKGDSEAFAAIFDQHHERVYAYCKRLANDSALAEDITQETFIRAHQNLHRFGPPWRLRPWLFQIARNIFLQHLNRIAPHDALDTDIPSSGPSPEQQAISGETTVLVQHALERLAPHYREALTLREVDGFPYSEIAGIMGISLDNVRVLLHRARATFRELYSAHMLAADPLPRCDALKDLLDTLHDGEGLGKSEQIARAHLKSCASCQRRRQEMVAVGAAVGGLPNPIPPSGLRQQVMRQINKQPKMNWTNLSSWAAVGVMVLLVGAGLVGVTIFDESIVPLDSAEPTIIPNGKRVNSQLTGPTPTTMARSGISNFANIADSTNQIFPVYYCTHIGNNVFEWYEVEVTYVNDEPVAEAIVSGPYSGSWQSGCPDDDSPPPTEDATKTPADEKDDKPDKPDDPPVCTPVCGDNVCDCGETLDICPGDCVIIP